MSELKRDLTAYADFLRQSGFLYVEGGLPSASASAPHQSGKRSDAGGTGLDRRHEQIPEVPTEDRGYGSRSAGPASIDMTSKPKNAVKTGRAAVPVSAAERDALEKGARARVAACSACSLCKTRTQTVYGTGSLDARIVFVGEAPGADEDRTGVPFVGRAGQLLTKMIESIGFQRDEVYICNTIKCRPPDNRDPTPEEKASCRPFLEEQLRILRPQILVALGAHAAGYLTGLQTSLGKMRRQWHEFEGVPTMVTYHPAFLLRSPGMKREAWEDLQMLISRYNELNPGDVREPWKKQN